jgi:hypothetical protein
VNYSAGKQPVSLHADLGSHGVFLFYLRTLQISDDINGCPAATTRYPQAGKNKNGDNCLRENYNTKTIVNFTLEVEY